LLWDAGVTADVVEKNRRRKTRPARVRQRFLDGIRCLPQVHSDTTRATEV